MVFTPFPLDPVDNPSPAIGTAAVTGVGITVGGGCTLSVCTCICDPIRAAGTLYAYGDAAAAAAAAMVASAYPGGSEARVNGLA